MDSNNLCAINSTNSSPTYDNLVATKNAYRQAINKHHCYIQYNIGEFV